MPFPVRISDANRADVGITMGPWALGGALYVFVLDTVSFKLSISKSTDGGVTWTYPDAANAPTGATHFPRYSVVQLTVTTTLRIVYGDNLGGGGGNNLGLLHYTDYDTLTDTYGAQVDSVIGWAGGGIADPAPSIVACQLSTGVTRVVFVNRPTVPESQLMFVDITAGVWGLVPAAITGVVATVRVQPAGAVVDPADRILLPYSRKIGGATPDLLYATINLAGTVAAGQLILAGFDGESGVMSIIGTRVALPLITVSGGRLNVLSMALGDPFTSDTPAWSFVSPDTNTYTATFFYQILPITLNTGGVLFFAWAVFDFFNPGTTAALWYSTSADGVSWAPPIKIWDTNTDPPSWTGIGPTDELSFGLTGTGTILFTGNVNNVGTATLAELPVQSIGISCDNPPPGRVGTPYAHTFPVTGGSAPFTFTIIGGALPFGLTLNPATGEVTGTPTTRGGVFTFTVQVTDSLDATASVECSIMIKRCVILS